MSSSSQFGISTLILLQVRKITDQRTTKAASDKKNGCSLGRLAAIFVRTSTFQVELGVVLQKELRQSRIIEISK